MELNKIEEIKSKLNERLKNLNIDIRVDANFIMMLVLLLEEINEPRS